MAKKRQVVRLFYRPRELANAMGCSYRTILALITRNQIPAVKFPGSDCLFIPSEWVDALKANLMADYEAFHADGPSGEPASASSPLGAANPSERPVDNVQG